MVVASQILVHDKLSQVAGQTELLVPCAKAPIPRRAPQFAGNGCVLMADLDNNGEPEVVAVVPRLTLLSRRRTGVFSGADLC